ncbi:Hypothetical predicted protein [Xyrichtys novacula]|uniref:Uncharacterized protein n=1 Tax=Xyrichtys novacula TaxID=13765 RepID=A0AAV1G0G8_XYRNO|nr:Hypothetical predicted protein [Xyrichtys novacula]
MDVSLTVTGVVFKETSHHGGGLCGKEAAASISTSSSSKLFWMTFSTLLNVITFPHTQHGSMSSLSTLSDRNTPIPLHTISECSHRCKFGGKDILSLNSST